MPRDPADQPGTLYMEPFLGWKGLYADKDAWLYSQHGLGTESGPERWPARERMEAVCSVHPDPPQDGCMCGIYALKTFAQLQQQNYNFMRSPHEQVRPGMMFDVDVGGVRMEMTWVLVNVYIFGDVLPGAIGWKGQYGRIKKVWVPPQKWVLGKNIASRYNCKVGLIDRFSKPRKGVRSGNRA